MRREVVRAALTAVWIAMVVLAIPLAVAVHLLLLADERGELERAALRAAVQVDPGFGVADPVDLPSAEPGLQLGLYDTAGRLRAGTGPASADAATWGALAGRTVRAGGSSLGGNGLVAAVPVSSGETVTAVIRTSSPVTTIWEHTALAWAALVGLLAAAQLAAVAVAHRRARRLAEPLEDLATASRAVGDGDFTVRVAPSGIAEIDHVAAAQNTTAARLGTLLDRERQFAANASHQLRTPLAGLQIGLETAAADPAGDPRAALAEALLTTRRLQQTVDEVLALHRRTLPGDDPGRGAPQPARQILDQAVQRWQPSFVAAGRQLTHHDQAGADGALLPGGRLAQILDVLLDNALRHGAGPAALTTRSTGGALAIDVTDQGPGIPDGAGDVFHRGNGDHHGIGLALARDFTQSLGGRLILSARTPPVFTVLLPVPEGSDPAGGAAVS